MMVKIRLFLGFVVLMLVFAVVALGPEPVLALDHNTTTIHLVAVNPDGEGMMTSLEVSIQEGRGRVLVATEPLIGIDTQASENTAVRIAERLSGVNLSSKDVIFTITASAPLVDGPSAGAAMTVAVFSAITNQTIDPRVIVTGTVEEDGTIRSVGGILQKARAAADWGFHKMLVPTGSIIQESEITLVGGIDERLVLNVSEYAANNWNLTVVEVENITQVLEAMLGGNLSLTTPLIGFEEVEILTLPDLSGDVRWHSESRIAGIATRMLERANLTVQKLREAFPNQNTSRFAESLSEAESLFETGYFYSAANIAFLVAVDAREHYMNRTSLLEDIERLNGETAWIGEFVEYPSSNLQSLAAAQQRRLWAGVYSGINLTAADEEYTNETTTTATINDLAAASEWLAACKDIAADLSDAGGEPINASIIEATARKELDSAYASVKVASVLGGVHARLAQRSLYFAFTSLDEGLPAGAVYNALDAKAYAVAATTAGTLQKILDTSETIRNSLGVDSPWATNYMRHSLYLDRKAREEQSLERARDSLYLAVRAVLVDRVFPAETESVWARAEITEEMLKKYLSPLEELEDACIVVVSPPEWAKLKQNPLVIALIVFLAGSVVFLALENTRLQFSK